MKPIRILIVEDDPAILGALVDHYGSIFSARDFTSTIETANTVVLARRLAKDAAIHPYDLVSLDVNLGDRQLTGIDVLDTLKRFQSAWMVVLLTGVETDTTLDATLGKRRADQLRSNLRRDAYTRFPAERLQVVEKPSSDLSESEGQKLLANRLQQIALLYDEIGRLRYVFRPIEVNSLTRVPALKGSVGKRRFIESSSLHWQIRFDCGELRTLPDMAGLRTLHYLLSRERGVSVTPEEALAIEPKKEKSRPDVVATGPDPVAAWFHGQGIEWDTLNSAEQGKLIRAALSLKFERYRELREFDDEGDLSPTEESELSRIIGELGPLAAAAETAYQRMKPPDCQAADSPEGSGFADTSLDLEYLHDVPGNYDRLGQGRRGQDSPAAQLFRARMKRVRDSLRENGLSEFAGHLEGYIQSTGANWSYNPPTGIEWTT
jgi:CheY-like chemotaxis protein